MFDFAAVLADWALLLRGAGMTLLLTAVAALVGVALGVACAQVRARPAGAAGAAAPSRPRRLLAVWVNAYVEAIRNTPFIVQLFFVYFGLPSLGLRMSSESASVLAMVLNLGAYAAEIVRAGIESTPRGQVEAARSLALSEAQVFLRVVLPPALGRVWPALVSQIVIVMLGSAVCGQIATQELSYAANLIQSRNFRAFEAFIVATLAYLTLSMLVRRALVWAGPRLLFGRQPQAGR
jgi:polar amino acid transport system permease protein